jgi:hypothetical protein
LVDPAGGGSGGFHSKPGCWIESGGWPKVTADVDISGEPGGCRYACKNVLKLADKPADAVSGKRVELSDLLWECCVAGTFELVERIPPVGK